MCGIVGYIGQKNTTKPNGTMIKLTDVSKLNSLGWRHTIDLQQGIDSMYNWYLGKANE